MLVDLRAEVSLALLPVTVAALSIVTFGIFVWSRYATAALSDRSARLGPLPHAMIFASHAAAVALSLHWIDGEPVPLIWPASGIALAGLLIGGMEVTPTLFLAYVVGSRVAGSGVGLGTDLVLALVTTGVAATLAKALKTWVRIDTRLTSVGDVLKLSVGALFGGGVSALLAVATVVVSGALPADEAPRVVVSWWLGSSVGCLLVAPPLLVWSYRSAWVQPTRSWLGLLLLLAAAAVLSLTVFFETRPGVYRIWYTYPLLIWVAVVYKVRGVSVALLVVAGCATWGATVGTGPFAQAADTVVSAVELAQHYTLVTAVSALSFAAAADERRSLEALHRSEARENSIVNTAQEPIIVADDRGRIVSFNRAAELGFGYTAGEVMGQSVSILMPEPYASQHDGYLENYHRTGDQRIIGTTRQVEGRRKDGTCFPLDLSVAEWATNGATFFTAIIHEQTERVAAERALRASELRLATAIEATGGGVYEQSVPATAMLYVSPQWLAILGYDALPVRPDRFDAWLADQVHPDDRDFRSEAWRGFIAGREPRYDAEVRKRHASGRWVWVRAYAQAIARDADGRVTRLSGIMVDITDRRAAESRAQHFARHDTLTGLSNRALFAERLAEAAAKADAARTRAGLVLVDLDHFKEINDTLGHPVGDAILQVVTDRIRASIRTSDTAARLGGDEFAVVVAGAQSGEDIAELAHRLHGAVARRATIEGREVQVEVSVGFATYPDDAATVELLMRHADLALYDAKRVGRNIVRAFEPPLAAEATNRSRIEQALRHAIEDNELVLHYQPQFDLESGRIRSVEALVRWPQNGVTIAPSEFIPIAETSGTIRALGEWVLWQAARQQAEWRAEGHQMKVAVNVSPVEVGADAFPLLLRRALAQTRLPGEALELEITEGLLMDPERPSVQAFLNTCKDEGIGLAIDDFGVGYSSLHYLMKLPISKVKIDRSFVANLDDQTSATLLEGMVSLGHGLGKRIVAEGVETETQLNRLREMGCDDVQGYLLCRPVDAETIAGMLRGQAACLPPSPMLHQPLP